MLRFGDRRRRRRCRRVPLHLSGHGIRLFSQSPEHARLIRGGRVNHVRSRFQGVRLLLSQRPEHARLVGGGRSSDVRLRFHGVRLLLCQSSDHARLIGGGRVSSGGGQQSGDCKHGKWHVSFSCVLNVHCEPRDDARWVRLTIRKKLRGVDQEDVRRPERSGTFRSGEREPSGRAAGLPQA